MKLGKETGSVMNHLYSRMTKGQPNPEVGMGVTFLMWTDRTPGTITKVFTIGKDAAIEVQSDNYDRADDGGPFTECQSYTFTPNPNSAVMTYRFDGAKWRKVRRNPETGRWNYVEGDGLRIGDRDAYRDPCF